ncbi:MAG: S-layer homology domain-containing protein [Candidatus Peribacteraceae bacterium]|nr:S-layer homology domain-containing protein [Candidatus Peribacteraceae bacterium]
MKKLLLAAASFALGMAPSVALSQEFRDPASDYVLEQQIMYPDAEGNFNGTGMVTRLEFTLATVDRLYPMEDFAGCLDAIAPSQPARYTLLFSDVDRTEWYAQRLCVGMRTGLIQGNADGSFRPFASITAAEASTIMARGYGLSTPALNVSAKPWYEAPMQSLANRGAIGQVAPGIHLSRSGMAQMFFALRDTAYAVTGTANTSEPTQPATQPTALPSSTPVMLSVPDVAVTAPANEDCPISRVNSPGTALLVLGLEAHPRTAVRPSTRALGALAAANYENGTFTGPDNGIPESNVLSRCAGSFTRTPAGALQAGTAVTKFVTGGRVPHRFLRAEAEQRGVINDFRIDRSVGY